MSPDSFPSVTRTFRTACGNLIVTIGKKEKTAGRYIQAKGDETFDPDKYCKGWFQTHSHVLARNMGMDDEKILKTHRGLKCPRGIH